MSSILKPGWDLAYNCNLWDKWPPEAKVIIHWLHALWSYSVVEEQVLDTTIIASIHNTFDRTEIRIRLPGHQLDPAN